MSLYRRKVYFMQNHNLKRMIIKDKLNMHPHYQDY